VGQTFYRTREYKRTFMAADAPVRELRRGFVHLAACRSLTYAV